MHVILITLIGIVIYSNTLNSPFQYDEYLTIRDNPIIKDFGYFFEPSKAEPFKPNYYSLRDRYVGYLSFAVNYRINGLDVKGFHIVNIVLHLLNSLLIYLLVRLTLRTPFFSGSPLAGQRGWIAVFAGLFFVSHPVQTEAVTYIMGRLPLLMSFFYLSSLVLYLKWRGSQTPLSPGSVTPFSKGYPVLYLLSLFSAVLAMKTKENAFTLPLMIMLFEIAFFPSKGSSLSGRILRLLPFLLTLLIVPFTYMNFDRPLGEAAAGIESATRHYTSSPRMSYFYTQMRVIVTYVRLIFFPVNQLVHYDYPVFDSFFRHQVLASIALHLSVLAFGLYLFYRSRRNPALRLISIGIFWFYLALSVESSLFPIPIIISEYRLYLPLAGVSMAIMTGAALLMGRLKARLPVVAALTAVVFVLTYAAHARNRVWASMESLWGDVVEKAPQNGLARNNLAYAYLLDEMPDKAIEQYEISLRLNYGSEVTHNSLGIALDKVGRTDEAEEHFNEAIRIYPNYAEAHNNLGGIYARRGSLDRAMQHFGYAVGLKPDYVEGHFNLALAYTEQGMQGKAIEQYRIVLSLDPSHSKARSNIERLSGARTK